MSEHTQQNSWKQLAAEAAVELVGADMLIGLGTGSTSTYFIQALGRRIQQGLRIAGAVCTSHATEQLAHSLGIPLTTLDEHPELDLAIDGSDEIDGQLRLIKGGGGALLREKIVASAARRFIIIGDVTKQVSYLGQHFPLPIEVVPFALTPVRRRLDALGARAQLRLQAGQPYVTENSNAILDCSFAQGIPDPDNLNARLRAIVGVVETGLFINIAHQAIIGGPGGLTYLPSHS